MMMTRRQAIKNTALASVVLATLPGAMAQTNSSLPVTTSGPFTLPPLPYAYDALEPYIDTETMHIHHDRHHAAYVANLNKALVDWPEYRMRMNAPFIEGLEVLLKDLNSVPENIRTAVRNNGGGHYNHSVFWQMMKPAGGGEPTGELAKAIGTNFGSFAGFKHQFVEAATKVFGSGWAWLVLKDGKLAIQSTPNQDCPISQGAIPLLGLDVWEHAYYLKHQNKRADYIAAWWNVVNWDFAGDKFHTATNANI
jgi:Fe-Mn family superoxide dismutase